MMVPWIRRYEKVTRVLGEVVPCQVDPAMVVSLVLFSLYSVKE